MGHHEGEGEWPDYLEKREERLKKDDAMKIGEGVRFHYGDENEHEKTGIIKDIHDGGMIEILSADGYRWVRHVSHVELLT